MGIEYVKSKNIVQVFLMKKQAVFGKLAAISFVFFVVSAINPFALARPKGIAFDHGDHDSSFGHGHRYFGSRSHWLTIASRNQLYPRVFAARLPTHFWDVGRLKSLCESESSRVFTFNATIEL
jgi:hypothetical protein